MQFLIRESAELFSRVQARLPEDILQAAVTEPRDALLGGQGGFQRQLTDSIGREQRAEAGFVESLGQRRGLCQGGRVIAVLVELVICPADYAAVHRHGSAQAGAVVKREQELMLDRDGAGLWVQAQVHAVVEKEGAGAERDLHEHAQPAGGEDAAAVQLGGVFRRIAVIPGEFVRAVGGGGVDYSFTAKMLGDLSGEGLGFRKFDHGRPWDEWYASEIRVSGSGKRF